MQAAWLAYGLPLLGVVFGVGAAASFADTDNEFLVIACGLFGLVAGLMAGRRILRKEECLQNMTPVAAHRIERAPVAESRT